MSSLFTDVRWWIMLFFLLRLISINAPITDSHNWRQADGYAIARNFLEIDSNPLYPRIDHAGAKTGIAGSEAPVMNYAAYLLYLIFGVQWWPGRLLNLLTSSVGIWCFHQIIARFIDRKLAFSAALILLSSIWFSHGRKFMPDVFSTSLVLVGVYLGWLYLKVDRGWTYLVGFAVFCGLGLLSKLPAFVATGFLFPAILDVQVKRHKKVWLFLVSSLILVPVVWWYFYWVPFLNAEYDFEYFSMGFPISESVPALLERWSGVMRRFHTNAIHYLGFGLFLVGITLVLKQREQRLLSCFLAVSGLQVLYLLKAGETFANHTYYIVPFVPMMALLAAVAISSFKLRWLRWALLLAVVLESALNQQHDLWEKEKYNYKAQLESLADRWSERGDLIAINTNGNPSELYMSHRKGWLVNARYEENQTVYPVLAEQNVKLIIWNKHRSEAPVEIPSYSLVQEDEDFACYVLEE